MIAGSAAKRLDSRASLTCGGWLIVVLAGFWSAASGAVLGEELLQAPVHSPAEQLGTFHFADGGYRIELVASEPMVEDPVALAFDGRGRLWVAEMRGFMRDIHRVGVDEPIGRIVVLEDLDGDGSMDQRAVFMDGLVLPRAIGVQPDGVLIADSQSLWFVSDPDGDLRPNSKELVDASYATGNVEHSANGLVRAMDNWIYNAKEGHRYRRFDDGWRRDETEPRGQWGICQDDWGRLFYNYNHSQLHVDLVPPNSLSRNPHHEPVSGLGVSVGASNRVFPIRATLASNRGYIPGALDSQGRVKEFTSACAPLIYRGALMREMRGDAFVCEPVGNLIKRNILNDDDGSLTATFAYPDREFLASTDERFRPVALANAPNGSIYIADMYRGVIQDGLHMSPYLREHSIQRSMDQPIHLGRIWRIVPEHADEEPGRVSIAEMSSEEWVEALKNSNGWIRDMAQMYLVETRAVERLPDLREMVLDVDAPSSSRLAALWTLEGLKDPEPERLLLALQDPEPRIRASALRVLSRLGLSASNWKRVLKQLVESETAHEVRLQLILTLGEIDVVAPEYRMRMIRDLYLEIAAYPVARDAALSSVVGYELFFLERLLDSVDSQEIPGVGYLLEALSACIIRGRDIDSISALIRRVSSVDDWRSRAILSGIDTLRAQLRHWRLDLGEAPESQWAKKTFSLYFEWPGNSLDEVSISSASALSVDEAKRFARGRQVYVGSCVACHGANGAGIRPLAPPLVGSDWVLGEPQRLIRVLLHGLAGPVTINGRVYQAPEIQPAMPPMPTLSNRDIAAVLTYIRNDWGNDAGSVAPRTVSWTRIETQGRMAAWTEAELEAYLRAGLHEE